MGMADNACYTIGAVKALVSFVKKGSMSPAEATSEIERDLDRFDQANKDGVDIYALKSDGPEAA